MTKVFRTIQEYDVWVDTETKEWDCTCPFGSFYRWSKKWMREGNICRHAKEVFDELENKKDS